MQRGHKWIAAAAVGALAASLFTAGAAGAHGDDGWKDRDRPRCTGDVQGQYTGRSLAIVALTTDGTLVCVDSTDPDRGRGVPVTGLVADTRLIGIDHRPATGVLYGVGELGGLYTIDAGTGVASKVAQMSVVPTGTTFGVDFNPTVDRLRVVSDTQQNLRVDVTTGATVTDLALSAVGVAGAAYTNNDADPNTATTLFDIDAAADQGSVQAPANNGNLSPTGKLGVDTSNAVGFDIHSKLRRGSTVEAHAFASLTVDGESGLYAVNLLTGKVQLRDGFAVPVADIAIPLDQL
jgi:Domain of unknown function (DUF4394)